MTAQRIAGVMMVVVQSAVAGYMFDRMLWPALLAVGAALGLPHWLQLELRKDRRVYAAVGMGVLVAVAWFVFPPDLEGRGVFVPVPVGYGFVLYLLLLQVSLFYIRDENTLPVKMFFYATVAMTFSGNILARGAELHVYRIGVLLFLASAAMFFVFSAGPMLREGFRRRGPVYLGVTTLVVALGLGGGMSAATMLKRYESELDRAFVRFVSGSEPEMRVAFPEESTLTSVRGIKSTDRGEPALRIEAKRLPGYLRGNVYNHFNGWKWDRDSQRRRLQPIPRPADVQKELLRGSELVAVRDAERGMPLDIWPSFNANGAMFTPRYPAAVETVVRDVAADAMDNVTVPENKWALPYRVWGAKDVPPTPPKPLSEAERARYLEMPDNLDPRIRDIAERLFQNAETTAEKVRAVKEYFQDNFEYRLEIEIPPGTNALAFFLLNQTPAHCEFFASGAAMLLRLGDVPCRYVVGFVAWEYNDAGGYWVARHGDAHSWVEAYDEKHGWFTVEATVTDGVPSEDQRASANYIRDMWDVAVMAFARARARLATGGLRSVLGTFFETAADQIVALVRSPAFWTGLLGVGLSALIMRRILAWRARRKTVAKPLGKFHTLLHKMDAEVKPLGYTRAPHETLHQFAKRLQDAQAVSPQLEQAAEWYRSYAQLRYSEADESRAIAQLRGAFARGGT